MRVSRRRYGVGSDIQVCQMAFLKSPPPSVWPWPGGRQRTTGYAAGQPVYLRQAQVGQGVSHGTVSVPMQPLYLSIRSRATSEPVAPVAGFAVSFAPVSSRPATGTFVSGGRLVSPAMPPAAGEMPRTMPPRAKASMYESQPPLLYPPTNTLPSSTQ